MLIEEIAKQKKYYPLCKLYAKGGTLTDDLHQEFLLRLCEIGQDKVTEAFNGGYLDWFCYDVVNNIWGKRNRVKCYKNGKTSPLFQLTNQSTDYTFESPEPDYNIMIDYHYKEIKNELERDINSSDIETNYKARVFTYSVGLTIDGGKVKEGGKFKNALQFSKKSGISYRSVYHSFIMYKDYLKNKLKIEL